jgi:hypothetical protein
MSAGAPTHGHPSVLFKVAAAITVAVLVLAFSRSRRGTQERGPEAATPVGASVYATWETTPAEDLAADQRFERSLVLRQLAVVVAIAALITLRQLAS